MSAKHPAPVLILVAMAALATALAQAAPQTPPAPAAPAAGGTPPAQAAPAAAPAVDDGARLQVYHDFRALFDAHKYADALPLAERLVTMTEAATAADDLALATPLVNLGATQYQTGDYPGAEASYLRAIRIIEQRVGGVSEPLIAPLHGLGLNYIAADQTDAAIGVLRRAVDVSRKVDGLFNETQLALLDPLIRCYTRAGQIDDAERERLYSIHVAESVYGADNIKVAPYLEKTAQWYSRVDRNRTARQYYGRELTLLQKALGNSDLRLVPPLRGIATTYRLDFLYGPEETEDAASRSTSGLGASFGTANLGTPDYSPATARLDPTGEQALRNALRITETPPNADPAQHAGVLIDLGDWLSLGSDRKQALQAYHQAWPLLEGLPPPQNAALSAPAQLMYRVPLVGIRSQRAKPEEIVEGYVDVEFTVTSDGRVLGEHVVGKDASDAQANAVLAAIKKARYRPRFEHGDPVETKDVRFHQAVFSVKPSSKKN